MGEKAQAFVPAALPPRPAIEWTPELRDKFDRAHLALGALDSASTLLPDAELFLKEAVFSSAIEGTRASLSDLLIFQQYEEPGAPLADDAREIINYVKALHHGLKMLKEGIPLSIRVFKDVHAVLLDQGRGSDQAPGEFRRSQNWIGGTRPGNAVFVPPPPEKVLDCMSQLEFFLHDQPEPTPVLLKAALAHVQFETIHPFLDGNGRLGRLLITLLLSGQGGVLQRPTLYLSFYFKKYQQYYYELLNRVRQTGDWEAWLDFFAEAVIFTARQAVDTAQQLRKLSREDEETIKAHKQAVPSSLEVHRALMEFPVTTSGKLAKNDRFYPAHGQQSLGAANTAQHRAADRCPET